MDLTDVPISKVGLFLKHRSNVGQMLSQMQADLSDT